MNYTQFKRSLLTTTHWRTERFRGAASEMFDMAALAYWKLQRGKSDRYAELREAVAAEYYEKYGTGFWIVVLVQVVLPIVIRLFLAWIDREPDSESLLREWTGGPRR